MRETDLSKPQPLQLMFPPDPPVLGEKNGAVYTKRWVVDLILDLAGYTPDADLVDALAVEPAAGDGAFVVAMAQRLIASCRRQERPVRAAAAALLAYELDEVTAAAARSAIEAALIAAQVSAPDAQFLADGWVRTGDYLADAPALPQATFVIGNPPYIRLEDMDPLAASAYRAAYTTMIGRADLYVAFFEAALRQLRPGGLCAFICADRWMLNQYGAKLRRLVTSAYAVDVVVEMHRAVAFDRDVSTYPAITVIRRAAQGRVVVANADAGAETTGAAALAAAMHSMRADGRDVLVAGGLRAARVDSWFEQDAPWPCVSPERLALLKRLEHEFPPLESGETATKVGIGVATGLDEVFITTDPELVEPSRLLPLAMASDTQGGTLQWSNHYLVDPWGQHGLVPLSEFPRLAAYFERHRERLQRRHVSKGKPAQWYRTIDRVTHALLPKRKLYIPDIKSRIHPVLDHGTTYPHHNLYFVQSDVWDAELLGGLLMSAVGQFFVECYGVRIGGGYLRFQAQYLRRIRVPHPHDISAADAARLVDAFRRRDVARATQVALDLYRIAALPVEGTGGR